MSRTVRSLGKCGASIAAACVWLAGTGVGATPGDPFDEMLKVCAANSPHAVAAAMSALHATELSPDRIDLIRLNWAVAIAQGQMHQEMTDGSGSVEAVPQFWGWELGRAILLTSADPKTPEVRTCSVSAPYDRFDAAIAALTGVLAYGQPFKQRQFDNVRAVAWSATKTGMVPDILVVSADFGGDRKPTLVQFNMH